jgi:hypothetical protein
VSKIIEMPRRRPQRIDSLAVIRAWREHCDQRQLHGSASPLSAPPPGRGGKNYNPPSAKKRIEE